jgi:hypothetical protein
MDIKKQYRVEKRQLAVWKMQTMHRQNEDWLWSEIISCSGFCFAARHSLPSLFLLAPERKALTLCERASGVWQVVRNQPLPVSEY